jgi:hypothetical protein
VLLSVPKIPCLVPAGVFDADGFGWCPSDVLEWQRPPSRFTTDPEIDATNPAGMIFVLRDVELAPFLPRELARLHMTGLDLGDVDWDAQWALAPYGIDDATDLLFEHRLRPADVLWLATDSLAGLVWGLHDWAHFHAHGPFEERAWTELQCDASALVWLFINRASAGIDDAIWERVRASVTTVARTRFDEERKDPQAASDVLAASRLRELAARADLLARASSSANRVG